MVIKIPLFYETSQKEGSLKFIDSGKNEYNVVAVISEKGKPDQVLLLGHILKHHLKRVAKAS